MLWCGAVQAKSFHDELQDTLQQLSEIDAQLATSQPVGGLPETAKKQLEQFQVCDYCACDFCLFLHCVAKDELCKCLTTFFFFFYLPIRLIIFLLFFLLLLFSSFSSLLVLLTLAAVPLRPKVITVC